ncbi:MAG TPA: hypothetical protein DCP31_34145 [Cyanobacteria bacterium UBA8543]|nr:hypothetical protein [Cyanobacteria bacterium UBA8543]
MLQSDYEQRQRYAQPKKILPHLPCPSCLPCSLYSRLPTPHLKGYVCGYKTTVLESHQNIMSAFSVSSSVYMVLKPTQVRVLV